MHPIKKNAKKIIEVIPKVAPLVGTVGDIISNLEFALKDSDTEESQKDTIAGLKSAEGYIRNLLAKKINLRNTPEIRFIIDQSIEYGVTMSKKIDEINSADRERHVDDVQNNEEKD